MRSAATACTSRSRRMIRSSPCTSTSCWSSGEKSTWSPTLICRQFGPTPRASPHTSRLATCAVAGIRMPPLERRSPSSLRSATSRRSWSILIGSPLFPEAEAMFSGTLINATRGPGSESPPGSQPPGTGGGPRISTPCSCAACASAAGSTGPGCGSSRLPAGPPTAAANFSNPLGVVICNVRSGSSGPTMNECANPAGSRTKSPGPAASSSPSQRNVARPPRSRNISSSTVCRCSGGAKPGGLRNSTTVARPPVWAPVALTVTRLPRNQTASPSSARRSRGRGDAGADMGAPFAGRRRRSRPPMRANRAGSAPAEFVEALLADAEVVGDLVDDRDGHLVDHVLLGLADVADGLAVDHDPVRQLAAVLPAALGQREPLVEPEQLGFVGVAVLDEDDDVVQQLHQLGRHLVEGVGHELLELLTRERLHQLVGSGRPSS